MQAQALWRGKWPPLNVGMGCCSRHQSPGGLTAQPTSLHRRGRQLLQSLHHLQGSLPSRQSRHRLTRAQMLPALLLRMRRPACPRLGLLVKVSHLPALPGLVRRTLAEPCQLAWPLG